MGWIKIIPPLLEALLYYFFIELALVTARVRLILTSDFQMDGFLAGYLE